jgi:DNA-binding response OmpR family regulator
MSVDVQQTSPTKVPTLKKVLVVEDCFDAARIARVLLERAGHTVETVRNGTEALVVATSFSPDVVLLDLGLPGVDGFQVARRLKAAHSQLLIVAVTGRTLPEDVTASREAGIDYHFSKPLNFEALTDVFEAMCGKS